MWSGTNQSEGPRHSQSADQAVAPEQNEPVKERNRTRRRRRGGYLNFKIRSIRIINATRLLEVANVVCLVPYLCGQHMSFIRVFAQIFSRSRMSVSVARQSWPLVNPLVRSHL